jgi:hypothetical protein
MIALIIELDGEIKEAFSYERPLNEGSHHALNEYALANYGPSASLRNMTPREQRNFICHGPDFFKADPNANAASAHPLQNHKNEDLSRS